MTRADAEDRATAELRRARTAREMGTEGMARVCARRAAGAALTFWLQHRARPYWGSDALGRLKLLARDPAVPEKVRESAGRLTARVAPDFSPPSAVDPLEDAAHVIGWLLADGSAG